MQKIIKWSLSIIIMNFSTINLIACINENEKGYDREYYVNVFNSDLRKMFGLYDGDFIKKYEDKIKTSASAESNQAFNDLYDNNPTTAPAFLNYATLADTLTNTMLGSTKINVNWTKLYQDTWLNDNNIKIAQAAQLRFYNIFAKVYHKENVLKLVQKLSYKFWGFDKTSYFNWDNNQIMEYEPLFANLDVINQQYQWGQWSTNSIITVSVNLYGRALSNFMKQDEIRRKTFNEKPWIFSVTDSSYKNQILGKPITDPTDLLMEFLNDQAIIDNNASKRLLFPFIVVRSTYSRIPWITLNLQERDDFFAEAFAQWLLTPQNLRGWNWQLLNDFFLHELPKYL